MYYVLDRFGARNPCRWLDGFPYIKGISWKRGARFQQTVPDPIELALQPLVDADGYGPEMPEYFKGKAPVFRDDLIAALVELGVDNMDLYNVKITDPDDGSEHTNYKAVNLLGLVKAADMQQSVATVHDGIPLVDVDFDELVVDEKKTGNILMFRLAESTNAILVHQKVKDHLLAQGFSKLEFLDPKEVAL